MALTHLTFYLLRGDTDTAWKPPDMAPQLKPKPFSYSKSSEALFHKVMLGTRILTTGLFCDIQGPPVATCGSRKGARGGEKSDQYSAL